MEQIIDAIKKRAWRSLLGALKEAGIDSFKVATRVVIKCLLTFCLMYVGGWSLGVGVFHGVNAALGLKTWSGGYQYIEFDVKPITVVLESDLDESQPNG
ncbi:MAG: hypothetical protein CML20_23015 [Rheinheimera sp.]|nr:hypothetical protein [Rheinheimera sp.]